MKPFSNQGLNNVKNYVQEVNETRSSIKKEPLNVLGVLPSKILTNSKYLEFVFPKQRSAVIERYDLPVLDTVIYERTALSSCINQTLTMGNLEIPPIPSQYSSSTATAIRSKSLEICHTK